MSWKTFKSLVFGVGIILLTSILMTACGDDTFKNNVALYASPTGGRSPIGLIPKNTSVTVLDEKVDSADPKVKWAKVKVSYSEAWIDKQYLKCEKKSCKVNK